MLLLYALAHPLPSLLSLTNESLPSPEASLEALNSCSDINSCRTVEEILYSCLAVVFACTWVAIHPNIPRRFKLDDGPDEIENSFTISSARVTAQDVITMILSLLAPELIILWALRQWFAARKVAKKYHSKYCWTKTHGHFLIMGGFALFEDNKYICTLEDNTQYEEDETIKEHIRRQIEFENSQLGRTEQPTHNGKPEDYHFLSGDPPDSEDRAQVVDSTVQSESTSLSKECSSEKMCLLEFLIQHKYIDITEDEITARSKTDFLTKSIAVVQTTWFIVQCIARVVEGLVVTDLEIVTVAFALLNIATYILWWNKPQRIRYPVKIDYCRRHATGKSRVKVKTQDRSFKERVKAMFTSFCDWLRQRSTGAWNSFKKWIEKNWEDSIKRSSSWPVRIIFFLILDLPLGNTFSFSIFHLSTDKGSYQTGLESDPPSLYPTVISLFLVFGGIHCAPWNSTFPTHIEQILWRVSAVTVTAFPLVWLPLFGAGNRDLDGDGFKGMAIRLFGYALVGLVLVFLPLAYIWARITLIVIAFTELRALPPSAYQTVDWARFIPHI
ncbi:hypothetical protein K435DRAFT_969862 [Dendrothele bispora CBS 962.96]|uniref:Uncharacterized protein n=1 Tax=Dendrothele bispora (strain CBS 962.96) TaxID=1314807 RepID=A0A4S8LEV6_DENBC|nr:hypothetical protein K435DRAFT_969862 [Dendrothele bispora CBS 962.96]